MERGSASGGSGYTSRTPSSVSGDEADRVHSASASPSASDVDSHGSQQARLVVGASVQSSGASEQHAYGRSDSSVSDVVEEPSSDEGELPSVVVLDMAQRERALHPQRRGSLDMAQRERVPHPQRRGSRRHTVGRQPVDRGAKQRIRGMMDVDGEVARHAAGGLRTSARLEPQPSKPAGVRIRRSFSLPDFSAPGYVAPSSRSPTSEAVESSPALSGALDRLRNFHLPTALRRHGSRMAGSAIGQDAVAQRFLERPPPDYGEAAWAFDSVSGSHSHHHHHRHHQLHHPHRLRHDFGVVAHIFLDMYDEMVDYFLGAFFQFRFTVAAHWDFELLVQKILGRMVSSKTIGTRCANEARASLGRESVARQFLYLGNSLAVPVLEVPSLPRKCILGVVHLNTATNFGSPDMQPTSFVVVLLTPFHVTSAWVKHAVAFLAFLFSPCPDVELDFRRSVWLGSTVGGFMTALGRFKDDLVVALVHKATEGDTQSYLDASVPHEGLGVNAVDRLMHWGGSLAAKIPHSGRASARNSPPHGFHEGGAVDVASVQHALTGALKGLGISWHDAASEQQQRKQIELSQIDRESEDGDVGRGRRRDLGEDGSPQHRSRSASPQHAKEHTEGRRRSLSNPELQSRPPAASVPSFVARALHKSAAGTSAAVGGNVVKRPSPSRTHSPTPRSESESRSLSPVHGHPGPGARRRRTTAVRGGTMGHSESTLPLRVAVERANIEPSNSDGPTTMGADERAPLVPMGGSRASSYSSFSYGSRSRHSRSPSSSSSSSCSSATSSGLSSILEGGAGHIHEAAELLPKKRRKAQTGLKWSRFPFGGLYKDFERRIPWYFSDLKDGINMKSVSAIIFLFFSCLTPAVAFGSLMDIATSSDIGIMEMILATGICGIAFAMLGGQPLIIQGGTGPLLIFTKYLFDICSALDINFLTMYGWVGLWSGLILIVCAILDASVLIRFCTRFTDEIFAALISVIFIYEAVYDLIHLFLKEEKDNFEVPLLSLILAVGTFYVAMMLRDFRHGKFLRPRIREFLSDFGSPIAVASMTLVSMLMPHVEVEKLNVPDQLQTTTGRSWFINLLDIPVWGVFLAVCPAFLASLLLFLDENITGRLVNRAEHRLQKGPAYHWDMLIVGMMVIVCSMMGLPWLVAATVRSFNHIHALSTNEQRVDELGHVQHVIVSVHETRVTGFLIHLLVGLSVNVSFILQLIPLSSLFGLFIFMGVVSLKGNQLWERIVLCFTQPALFPPSHYVRHVRFSKIVLFTLLQVSCLGILWGVKASPIAIVFPLFIVALIPVRFCIGLLPFFSKKDLMYLDGEEEVAVDEDPELA